MKTMTTKILIVFGLLVGIFTSLQAQEVAKPASFVQHGNNSLNATVATENTDSVTVGAVMKYWVEPDSNIPSTSSVYTWTIPAALGSQTAGASSNLATVTFGTSVGTGLINVLESTSTGCSTGTGTDISVEVITKPTAKFTTTSDNQCVSLSATVNYNLPIQLGTSVKTNKVTLTYTITDPSGTTGTAQIVTLPISTTTLPIAITPASSAAFGAYKVNITAVSDHISVKSAIAGDISGAPLFTLTINRKPVTGKVYHLPNK
jgi:hypothetical protein